MGGLSLIVLAEKIANQFHLDQRAEVLAKIQWQEEPSMLSDFRQSLRPGDPQVGEGNKFFRKRR